ncbi:arsenate reductase/protein-tyrosine-phosphatase family protein [Jatrophihabitans sp. YIM 134969]
MTAGLAVQRAGATAGRHRRFEVLTLCTANLCRSPDMEAQLRADLAAVPGSWAVSSAGVRARPGLGVHPLTAAALAERGLALPDDWRSRPLTAELVEGSDLVLAATRAHRGAAVALAPMAAGRIFTLHQFTRLIRAAGATGVEVGSEGDEHPGDQLLRAAAGGRGLSFPARADDDDLTDPIGGPFEAYQRTAAQIAAASAVIAAAVPTPR